MTNLIISWIVFAGLVIWLLAIIFRGVYLYTRYGRSDLIKYVKNFKFGKWAAINVLSIPLFTIAFIDAGKTVADSIFRAITSATKLITLNFEFQFNLIDTCLPFKIALFFAYALIILNTIAIAISIFCQMIWYARVKCISRHATHNCFANEVNLGDEYKSYNELKKELDRAKCFVIGDDSNNKLIYQSRSTKVTKHGKTKYIWNKNIFMLNVLNKQQTEQAFFDRISTLPFKTNNDLLQYIVKNLIVRWAIKNSKNKQLQKIQFIINFKDEANNIRLSTDLAREIIKIKEDDQFIEKLSKISKLSKNKIKESINEKFDFLDIYVYGTNNNSNIYTNLTNKTSGIIHYRNKQQQITNDFVDNYPIAKYLDNNQLDKDTGLIKGKDVKINVIFVGLGDTNRQIFLGMFCNNQLFAEGKLQKRKNIEARKWSEKDGFVKNALGNISHPINYHFFEKSNDADKKNISHLFSKYLKFEEKFNLDQKNKHSEYLLPPQYSAHFEKDNIHTFDVKSREFYENLKNIVIDCKNNPKSLTYVIVSLGDNGTNIDVTNKITNMFVQEEISNFHIFVSSKTTHFTDNKDLYLQKPVKEGCSVEAFGCPDKVVYNYSRIIELEYTNMGIMMGYLYDVSHGWVNQPEYAKDGWTALEWKQTYNMRKSWNMQSLYNFESSLNGIRAIKSYLNLIGLDLVKAQNANKKAILTQKQYEDKLASNNPISKQLEIDNGKIKKFRFNFTNPDYYKPDSVRSRLASLEHNRWNAFVITWGYLPMPLKEMFKKDKNGKEVFHDKDAQRLLHPNLCAFEELFYLWQKTGIDKIKEDYRAMDNAYWMAINSGLAIVDKSKMKDGVKNDDK